ncbi:MAG TPA: hypothetical protein VJ785_06420 [Anaerolineales bacterium]|nr:hypothetical protein [Anaerolineales bacterium]
MIEMTYLALAGIALLAMFLGYGFGLFEGRSQGYKKRRKEEAIEKENEPPAQSKSPAPTPEPVVVQADDPGLLRIKNEGGYLTLDLDGSRMNTSSLTADQRKRLIEMLTLMRPWLEGKPAVAPVVKPSPLQSQPTPVEADRQGTPAPSTSAAAPPPVRPQKPATIAVEDRPLAPAGSIVSQIDSILQARIEGTPLDDRGVFLAQSSEGGVMVYVGLTKYMGIDEVPDPEIKAAIRSAITEWENKFTPGL